MIGKLLNFPVILLVYNLHSRLLIGLTLTLVILCDYCNRQNTGLKLVLNYFGPNSVDTKDHFPFSCKS